ncbi:glutaredoxin family protein [Teredinibacter sp. KSP-S5-2]|uniref:glutaredoxin family protein n=1 Tax=Teredinibacter sp. KSP-S5-2 TaxID=3034506 RepID=UPI0039777F73
MSNQFSLYYRPTCFFCVRVLQQLPNIAIGIKTLNISEDREALLELREKGGKQQVPALKYFNERGEETWMYESLDILNFLNTQSKD